VGRRGVFHLLYDFYLPSRRLGEGGGVETTRVAIYGPMIYLAPYASQRFGAISQGPKKSRFPETNPLLLVLVMDFPASKAKHYVQGLIDQRSIGSFLSMSFQGPVQ
jgi:hypothetical protein